MSQMDQITQSNAANAEESASASEQIMGVMGQLQQLVQGSTGRQETAGQVHNRPQFDSKKRPGLNQSDQLLHRIAQGGPAASKSGTTRTAPAIPLDDSAMGDFNG